MRRQEQFQAEHDRAEDDVFAKVALKEKLDKEVCGGYGLRNRGEGEGEGKGKGEGRGRGRGRMPEMRRGGRAEGRESKVWRRRDGKWRGLRGRGYT